ncbi:Uncharacterised protein [Mycobacteroides abscessus subsp. bolletii]|nr:Uncharacterised protein [Mycobacteroides abscessus subsp. bolletii]
MQPEPHALVVSAECEPAKARLLRPGVLGFAAEFADGHDCGVNVRNAEKHVDPAVLVIVVQTASRPFCFKPGLSGFTHRMRFPAEELHIELLSA